MTHPPRKRSLVKIAGLVALTLAAVVIAFVTLHLWSTQDEIRTYPGIDRNTTVDGLVLLLKGAPPAQQEAAILAFADAHRPAAGFDELSGQYVRVVVGANGSWDHPDGYDAPYDGPFVPEQVILVAGNGKNAGIRGTGGKGGKCELLGMPGAARLVVCGDGGRGGFGLIKGGRGGDAGLARSGSSCLSMPESANGGKGGASVFAGGAGGGAGGQARPEWLHVAAWNGNGGNGIRGGDGGGR